MSIVSQWPTILFDEVFYNRFAVFQSLKSQRSCSFSLQKEEYYTNETYLGYIIWEPLEKNEKF